MKNTRNDNKKAIISLVAGMSLFLVFNVANAGLFYFSDTFLKSNEKNSPKTANFNVQNSPILESFLNTDTVGSVGGGDITIINNNSLLSDSGPMGTVADIEDGLNNDQISVYVVREGDSLSQIATMFNVSVNTIVWSNEIGKDGKIIPGQTLTILPISGIKYEIKKGDTLKSIAKKLHGDIDEIIKYNDLSVGDKLAEGQTIIIPNGEIAPTPPAKNDKKTNPYRGGSGKYYAGYYIRPILGGYRSQDLHGYNGVDLADGSCGSPVVASAGGDVVISREGGWNGGYGNYVVISHNNGTQTLYAHLSSSIVSSGWHITQGQVVGYIGSTGKSTGCHLHFEVRGAKNPF